MRAVLDFWKFDFHTTCAFVHYKSLLLIHLWYAEFRLSYTADEQTFQVISQFDFHTTCAFVHYKSLLLIHLWYTEFRLSYTADKQTFQVISRWFYLSAKPTLQLSTWSEQHYYLRSLAPKHKTAKESLTLPLGGIAGGYCKVKPVLVYHLKNRPLKGKAKRMLPIV
jgi:hypothetical protein